MDSLERMKHRLSWTGYDLHEKQFVDNKYRSFQSALKRSYQSEWITLDENSDNPKRWRCLINPSRLTEQFDKKVISIDFASGVREGTIFYWDRTHEHWLVNLQQHTEEAYFRGLITRCDYEIDVDGTKYWATVRGPIETTTQWNEKHRTVWNDLNYSLAIQVTKDSRTVEFFTRHQVFKVKMYYRDADTGEMLEKENNWKVVATDKYSSDNIIEVYADEWYNDEAGDLYLAEEKVREEEIAAREKTVGDAPHIEGPHDVNVADTGIKYTVVGCESGIWKCDSPKVKVSPQDKDCFIDILTTKSDSFSLVFIPEGNEDNKLIHHVRINSF